MRCPYNAGQFKEFSTRFIEHANRAYDGQRRALRRVDKERLD